jgi:tetratricopeptide (TPR) repeat protein
MNDLYPRLLRQIVADHGRSMCDDPRRCRAILRDYLGAHPGRHDAAVHVLVAALEQGVARDLAAAPAVVPFEALLHRLAGRLQEDLALTPGAARWAVATWGAALGLCPLEDAARLQLTDVAADSPPASPRSPTRPAAETPKSAATPKPASPRQPDPSRQTAAAGANPAGTPPPAVPPQFRKEQVAPAAVPAAGSPSPVIPPQLPSTEPFEARVDEILAKVARGGRAGLTEEENRILQEASRRARDRGSSTARKHGEGHQRNGRTQNREMGLAKTTLLTLASGTVLCGLYWLKWKSDEESKRSERDRQERERIAAINSKLEFRKFQEEIQELQKPREKFMEPLRLADGLSRFRPVPDRIGIKLDKDSEKSKEMEERQRRASQVPQRVPPLFQTENLSSLADYTKRLEINPRDHVALTDRAKLYFLMGDTAKGITDLEEAVRIQPSLPAQSLLGAARGRALSDYTKRLETNPRDHVVLTDRAGIYLKLGDQRKAISDLEEALEIEPSYQRALNLLQEARLSLGEQLFAASRYVEANEVLQALVGTGPDDARAWYFAALSLGAATNQWLGETERLVTRGAEREKAGTPATPTIDEDLAGLDERFKSWIEWYRKRARVPADRTATRATEP